MRWAAELAADIDVANPSRHRRRHVYRAGMGVLVLSLTAWARRSVLSTGDVHGCAMDMPSAMPR